ncbi:MAG: hypothetical protein AAGG79_03000 [Pseudomonadota bacterium]
MKKTMVSSLAAALIAVGSAQAANVELDLVFGLEFGTIEQPITAFIPQALQILSGQVRGGPPGTTINPGDVLTVNVSFRDSSTGDRLGFRLGDLPDNFNGAGVEIVGMRFDFPSNSSPGAAPLHRANTTIAITDFEGDLTNATGSSSYNAIRNVTSEVRTNFTDTSVDIFAYSLTWTSANIGQPVTVLGLFDNARAYVIGGNGTSIISASGGDPVPVPGAFVLAVPAFAAFTAWGRRRKQRR